METMVPLEEPEGTRPLDPSDRGPVHEVMETLVGTVIDANGGGDRDQTHKIGKRHTGGAQSPPRNRPRDQVQSDQQRAAPPLEGERLLLFLVMNVECIVMLAELVVHEGAR